MTVRSSSTRCGSRRSRRSTKPPPASARWCSATLKNLELLVEGGTVAGAIAAAGARKVVTVQPWVEQRDGKRFLHIPPDAGYRNLFRELPPT